MPVIEIEGVVAVATQVAILNVDDSAIKVFRDLDPHVIPELELMLLVASEN